MELFDDISISNYEKMLKLLQIEHMSSQMNYDLFRKVNSRSNRTNFELKRLATTNFITNLTTIYAPDHEETVALGSIFKCEAKNKNNNNDNNKNHIDAFNPDLVYPPKPINNRNNNNNRDLMSDLEMNDSYMNWELKTEIWVAIGLTMSTLGILLCVAILTFIIIRICMDDVLEGNPIGSVVMLTSLIAQFASFFPFTIEYVGSDLDENGEVLNSMCIIKIFLISVCYCLTFSLLLSRAIMLASIGSEGGFLSHVNGYIQSIICVFSFFVQLGLSTQLLIVLHANSKHITCLNIYNGNWFWAVIAYDGILLIMLLLLSPFIYKSQRNYQEGTLIVITSILCCICWSTWIPLSMIENHREIMISLGVQATAWIILATLMVPRCFLIVKSIARSDFTQALPSLTSLAFAQANQFISEPVKNIIIIFISYKINLFIFLLEHL
jgi:bride of sevenless protein